MENYQECGNNVLIYSFLDVIHILDMLVFFDFPWKKIALGFF